VTDQSRIGFDDDMAQLPPPGRAEMPADWSSIVGHDFHGCVRHVRRFGRPTGLESGERVWLVCDGAADAAEVILNEVPLGKLQGLTPIRCDITELLQPRNQLVVDVTFPEDSGEIANALDAAGSEHPRPFACGGLIGEVRLEIL
jgi:hypothetical protein